MLLVRLGWSCQYLIQSGLCSSFTRCCRLVWSGTPEKSWPCCLPLPDPRPPCPSLTCCPRCSCLVRYSRKILAMLPPAPRSTSSMSKPYLLPTVFLSGQVLQKNPGHVASRSQIHVLHVQALLVAHGVLVWSGTPEKSWPCCLPLPDPRPPCPSPTCCP